MVPLGLRFGSHVGVALLSLALTLCALDASSTESASLSELRKRAEQGDLASQERLGFALAVASGADRDEAGARKWLAAPAAAGRPWAQILLASLYESNRASSTEFAKSYPLYLAAANKGYAPAQFAVGQRYYLGIGVQRDLQAARKWFEAAAAQGDDSALEILAHIYMQGSGVDRDMNRAVRFAMRAAELGNVGGQLAAANFIFNGQTGPTYDARLADTLLLAAANNWKKGKVRGSARYQMGWQSYFGRKRERNGEAAVRWLNAAIEDNYEAAGVILAVCYWKGFGTPPNPTKAKSSFEKALATTSTAELNDIAWALAVDPTDGVRDGVRAVQIMQNVLRDPAENTAMHFDTLAAAYAETGQFDLAKGAEEDALNIVAPPLSEEKRKEFRQRLDLYNRSHAYREAFAL